MFALFGGIGVFELFIILGILLIIGGLAVGVGIAIVFAFSAIKKRRDD